MTSPARHAVLVHGIFDTGRIFATLARDLESRGFVCHAPTLRPRGGLQPLESWARQLAAVVELEVPASEKFHLIGFSMGGMVCRYFVQRLGGGARLGRLVTISTPHHGSRAAWLLATPGSRQLRPGSDFVRDLNRDVAVLAAYGFTSLWTRFDLMVVPARSSVIAPARCREFPVPLHALMVWDRRVIAAVADALL
ncbi:MAG: alpha/beta fold hydrolase [Deltaproteobacteria bacterium]|nr:alpha/beta fold hydrolase [Deltaproteobacteria bacterium]